MLGPVNLLGRLRQGFGGLWSVLVKLWNTARLELGLPSFLCLSLGLWLALAQVDQILASLQSTGLTNPVQGAYGVNDLATFNPADAPARAEALLAVWNDNRPVATTAFWVYTLLDVLFVCAYWLVFVKLFGDLDERGNVRQAATPARGPRTVDRGLSQATKWVGALVVADVVEDMLRALMFLSGDGGVLAFVACVATWVKWVLLLLVLMLVAAAWSRVGWADGPGRLAANRLRAFGRLRVPVVLLSAWELFILFDPTGQTADIFRRWLDSIDQFVVSAVWTFGAVVLLGLATWTTARRSILAHYVVYANAPSRKGWVATGGVLAVVALGGWWWRNLWGIAITVFVFVFVLEAVRSVVLRGRDVPEMQMKDSLERRQAVAKAPKGDLAKEIRRVALALSVGPVLVLMLGLASAWIRPAVVLFALGEDMPRAVPAAFFAVVGLLLAALLAGVRWDLDEWDLDEVGSPGRPGGLEYRHVAVAIACLAISGAAIAYPLDVPPFVGAVAMTAIVLALMIVLLGEAQRYGDTHPPTLGLTFVGFARVPVTLLLGVAFVIASFFNDGSYHSVSRNDELPPGRDGAPLAPAFVEWTKRNCAKKGDDGRMVPMVFVAAPGGGIRAAYWTSSVLTQLLGTPAANAGDKKCRTATTYDRVFAMGGASGGSLGITVYAGHAEGMPHASADGIESEESPPWYRDVFGDSDFASVPTTWGMLVDLPRNFAGFHSPDRARRFEEAWEHQDPTLRKDFFKSQGNRVPYLLLAGTQVETGCRLNVSAVRLTTPTESKEQGECATLADPTSSAVDPGRKGAGPVNPAAALTSDVLDYLCDGRSLNRSAAALMSARFPYVSPSGQLKRCAGNRPTAVVDGGYAENTGARAVLDLWARLEPLIAEHNEVAGHARIVPIFVLIDNHYAKAAKVGPIGRTHELIVPPRTAGRPDQLDDRGVEQTADAAFSVELPGAPGQTCAIGAGKTQRFIRIAPPKSPGIPAPLAWTLSRMAMDELDSQRDAAVHAAPVPTLRDVLTGQRASCMTSGKRTGPEIPGPIRSEGVGSDGRTLLVLGAFDEEVTGVAQFLTLHPYKVPPWRQARRIKVSTKSFRVDAKKRVMLRVGLSPKVRTVVPSKVPIEVRVTARDMWGAARTEHFRITFKLGKRVSSR